jgi:hypothetical protein
MADLELLNHMLKAQVYRVRIFYTLVNAKQKAAGVYSPAAFVVIRSGT